MGWREICQKVNTPAYVIDESLLKKNLQQLSALQQSTGCHILLAQKAFSMFYFYPLLSRYLSGSTASGLYEARLAHENMVGENHIFSPAYNLQEFTEILNICDHIVFNSGSQWRKYASQALASGVSCGLRVNPEKSTQEHSIYDPCAPHSRLGIKQAEFKDLDLEGISGLHFHTLCEQDAAPLAETLAAVEDKFGYCLPKMQWINFGGGHHLTKPGYDMDLLKSCIGRMQDKYQLEVYLEPGEAVALQAGFLVAEVLEIVDTEPQTAILDASAACHMPDVLEMPYRPPVVGAGAIGEKSFDYILAGATCLAGDSMGSYSFDEQLQIGSRVIFADMAIYTMVKNNTFNGMPLPDIVVAKEDGAWEIVRHFGYEDFKSRLS